MKICIAIEKFDPTVGGAERYCWDLAHFLSARGHKVAVDCMRSAPDYDPAIAVERLPVWRFPQGLRHLSFALSQRRAACRKPDYLHFGVGNTFCMDVYQPHGGLHRAWFVRDSRRQRGIKRRIFALLKRLSLKDIVQRGLEKRIFTDTRPLVVAISAMVRQDILNWFSYPPERVRLLPNGIDVSRFTPDKASQRETVRQRYWLASDDFVFVFVAQNLGLKGFDVLVDAVWQLFDKRFKILVVGPATAADRAKVDGLEDRFVFAGTVSDMDLIYPACDALVHPTYYDACSLVVLEALASSLPVITTTANGASMYLDDSNGRVIAPGDATALKVAMAAMMRGPRKSFNAQTFKDQAAVFTELEAILEEQFQQLQR